jgi:hypothetical protein
MDFQADVTIAGHQTEVASIVDEYTRECSDGTVERGITGEQLTGELRHLVIGREILPAVPLGDKGVESVRHPILLAPRGRLGHYGVLDPVLHGVPAAAASSTGSKAGVARHRNTVEHSI